MEQPTINFEEMKKESDKISSELEITEYYPNQEEGKSAELQEKIDRARELVGRDFDRLSPELQRQIAELPVVGSQIETTKEEEVTYPHDLGGESRIIVREAVKPGTEITFDELVFVRAEKFGTPTERDGALVVQNAYESTRGLPSIFDNPDMEGGEVFVPRITSHWTLNHRVESHGDNIWDDAKLIILSPGQGMIAKNGLPNSLVGVDTFFEQNTTLPEGTVIITQEGAELPQAEGITYIEIGREDDMNIVASVALRKMGYTEVKGAENQVKTVGFDEAVAKLRKKIGIKGAGGHALGNVGDFYYEVEFGVYGGMNTRMKAENMLISLGNVLAKFKDRITAEYAEDFLDHLNRHIIPKLTSDKDKQRAEVYLKELGDIVKG